MLNGIIETTGKFFILAHRSGMSAFGSAEAIMKKDGKVAVWDSREERDAELSRLAEIRREQEAKCIPCNVWYSALDEDEAYCYLVEF